MRALIKLIAVISALSVKAETQVFSSEQHKVSFRYSSDWVKAKPQLKSTLVLLYARDGSLATCNLSYRRADASKTADMDKSYWEKMLANAYPNSKPEVKSLKFINSISGQQVIVEHDFILETPDGKYPSTSFIAAAVRGGVRYILNVRVQKSKYTQAKKSFSLMAGTLLINK